MRTRAQKTLKRWTPLLVLTACLVFALGLASAALAQDIDGDTVLDENDNCPFVSNVDQSDVGGFGAEGPDGIGDACQCVDLNDDGRADLVDAAIFQRELAGLAPGVNNLDKCSGLGGRLDCDHHDLNALREELIGVAPGATQVCQAATGALPLPMDIAAAGDSITRGFAADCTCNGGIFGPLCLLCLLGGDQPEHSWFDGDDSSVTSVHDRYLGLDPAIGAKSEAVTGAEMTTGPDRFSLQVDAILAQTLVPEFVVIELGGNDLCSRGCVSGCSDPLYTDAQWTTAVRSGLDKLVAGLPLGSTVHLLGAPRVQDLRAAGLAKQAGASNIDCEDVWSSFDICSIATQASDFNGENLATRLAGVAERQQRYNEILRDEALAYTTNSSGQNPRGIEVTSDYVNEVVDSVGTTPFGADEINGGDCFHPSLLGQNIIGGVVWGGNPRR